MNTDCPRCNDRGWGGYLCLTCTNEQMEELIKEWRGNAHAIRLVLPDHGEAAVWDHCADELEATLREGGYGFSDEPIAPHQHRYMSHTQPKE